MKISGENVFGTNKFSSLETVEIYQDEFKLTSFEFDFKNQSLDLSKVSVKYDFNNQSNIILSGFESLGLVKTVYLKNNLNLNYVCVKDTNIRFISEISTDCSSLDEIYLNCNTEKTFKGISCRVSENYYVVSGLTNTAVLEVNSDMISSRIITYDYIKKNKTSNASKPVKLENYSLGENKIFEESNKEITQSRLGIYILGFLFVSTFIIIYRIFVLRNKENMR